MNKQSADQWLIDHVGLEQFKGGFERVSKLLKPLAEQIQKKSKIIIIAGTNGKGQTSFDLFELLKTSGKKVALWTSPHILSVTERFAFSDRVLTEDELCQRFINSQELLDQNLSYYEFLFAVFCRELLGREDEFVILEVGLGGRLDAVNVFDADIAAVVSISLDHQAILGNSLEKILKEKWGVTRVNQMVLTTLESAQLREEVRLLNLETGAQWSDLFESGHLSDADAYPVRNNMLALCLWRLSLGQSLPSAEQARLDLGAQTFSRSKGRQEEMTIEGHRFIFIGAHNVDGIEKMMVHLTQKRQVFDQVWTSFSARPFEEIGQALGIFAQFKKTARQWKFFEFEHPKALRIVKFDHEERQQWEKWILELCQQKTMTIKIEDCLQGGLNVLEDKGQTILVTGSYYFIANVQKLLL